MPHTAVGVYCNHIFIHASINMPCLCAGLPCKSVSMFWGRGMGRDKGEDEQQNSCVLILECLGVTCTAPDGRSRILLAAV